MLSTHRGGVPTSRLSLVARDPAFSDHVFLLGEGVDAGEGATASGQAGTRVLLDSGEEVVVTDESWVGGFPTRLADSIVAAGTPVKSSLGTLRKDFHRVASLGWDMSGVDPDAEVDLPVPLIDYVTGAGSSSLQHARVLEDFLVSWVAGDGFFVPEDLRMVRRYAEQLYYEEGVFEGENLWHFASVMVRFAVLRQPYLATEAAEVLQLVVGKITELYPADRVAVVFESNPSLILVASAVPAGVVESIVDAAEELGGEQSEKIVKMLDPKRLEKPKKPKKPSKAEREYRAAAAAAAASSWGSKRSPFGW